MKPDLCTFVDGIEAHNRFMAQQIQSQGVYVHLEHGYGYTVGLAARGLPELFMVADDPEKIRQQLFDLFYAAVEHQAIELRAGPVNGLFLDGVALEPLTEAQKRKVFFGGRTLTGTWSFDAMQVVAGG